MQNDTLNLQLLKEEWNLLEASVSTLQRSVDKCRSISGKTTYSFEEEESFDSLTSKFGRTSDLFTQKIIRTIWILLHEPFVPFIDLTNKCEKMEIIHSSDSLIDIRDLRNQIAHEYIPSAIHELIPEVLLLADSLIQNIDICRVFLLRRQWIEESKK
ncbi:MAG: hypothetical protein H6Q17_2780 [Bacteroidetes bacterium]|nr:hypothetical protein [Bacteroidota bacterium]